MILAGELVPDACHSLFHKLLSVFSPSPSSNVNVNLQKVGDDMLVISDFSTKVPIDMTNLETKGVYRFTDTFGDTLWVVAIQAMTLRVKSISIFYLK